MTQTTTELLESIREHGSEALLDALEKMQELDGRLTMGEPLPDQWRGKSDRDVVEAWLMENSQRRVKLSREGVGDLMRARIKLYCPNMLNPNTQYFWAKTSDDTYALAAEWCKENA